MKRRFSDTEIGALVGEVEVRKPIFVLPVLEQCRGSASPHMHHAALGTSVCIVGCYQPSD